MSILIFLKLLSETFLILRSIQPKNHQQCTYVSMYSTLYSCQILMKLVFSQQISKKYSNIKCHKNPSSGSWAVLCRQTWRSSHVISAILQMHRRSLQLYTHSNYAKNIFMANWSGYKFPVASHIFVSIRIHSFT
jgi:hypothetical protein